MPEPEKPDGTTNDPKGGAAATATPGADPNTSNGAMDSQQTGKQTYTDEEVRKLLQSESDRRVTEALKKKDKELEELKRQIELDKLSKEEREKEERRQREEALKKEKEALEAEKRDFETLKIIAERKLDPNVIELLKPLPSIEKRKEMLELFEKTVKTEVETRLKQMQRGSYPDDKNKPSGSKYVQKRPQKTVFDEAREKL